jgi:hypothetical protein
MVVVVVFVALLDKLFVVMFEVLAVFVLMHGISRMLPSSSPGLPRVLLRVVFQLHLRHRCPCPIGFGFPGHRLVCSVKSPREVMEWAACGR